MSNNSSTNKKLNNDGKSLRTSRFTPKIREYLAEMAHERQSELERFMALSSSSPASSVSVGAHSNNNNNTNSDAMRSSSRCRSRSHSRGAAAVVMECIRMRRQREDAQVIEIPIEMETACSSVKEEAHKPSASASVEDLRPPTKCTQTPTTQMQTRKTQTPESALKCHKRLEWDPAADVGYRCERASSVSNISTLERSVLEAAMQPMLHQSDSDLHRLQAAEQEQTLPAPPLASSTFVNRSGRTKSCRQSQTTPAPSTSHSSRRESCVTSAASSFDYHQNSRPSTAGTGTSNSSSRHTLSAEELLRHVEQQRQEREYTAHLEKVLCNRRQLTRQQNKENQEPVQQLQPQKQIQTQTKSTSTSTSATGGPAKCDLDLGIDLLCSLVSKRSLSSVQKKQLVRDIAKRLACLELVGSSSTSSSRNESQSSSRRSRSISQQPTHAAETVPKESPHIIEHEPKNTVNRQQLPCKDMATNTSRCPSASLHRSSTAKTAQSVLQPVSQSVPQSISYPVMQPETPSVTQHVKLPVPAPRTRIATPIDSPLQPCSYASTSSGASNELVTQKTNLPAKSTGSQDAAEHVGLQDWLHPMTQSEIEYEEKRQRRQSLDTERRTQLDWIDNEIQRLRTLQNLLNNAARGVVATQTESQSRSKNVRRPVQIINARCMSSEKTAADVSTEPPVKQAAEKVWRGAAPPAPPVTPVLTPTAAAVEAAADAAVEQTPAPATTTPPAPALRQMQRSKMATPALSNSGSSESVCSFVQQRQRQFFAHYQNQQQQRLEQQQQLIMLQQRQQQQQQHKLIYQQHQLQHHHHHHHQQQHQQHQTTCPRHQQEYMPMQYTQTAAHAYSCADDGAVYYQVLNSQEVPCYVQAVATTAPPATVAAPKTVAVTATRAATVVSSNSRTATSSTSSLLCISSDMSIPMGIVSACEAMTTTTTTTTHQYDDVACQQLQLRQRRRHKQREASTDEQRQQLQQQLQQKLLEPHEQRQRMLQIRPNGIAYFIQLSGSADAPDSLSLQDYLQLARPQFCAQSKQRKAILNQMQLLRNERRRELDELINSSSIETLDTRLRQLPPPPISRVRIFSTKEMKALTSKRCESLPEVLAAQNREREERRRRSNRIMRDVFNRRLQRRVRRGKLSLNHSRTVI